MSFRVLDDSLEFVPHPLLHEVLRLLADGAREPLVLSKAALARLEGLYQRYSAPHEVVGAAEALLEAATVLHAEERSPGSGDALVRLAATKLDALDAAGTPSARAVARALREALTGASAVRRLLVD